VIILQSINNNDQQCKGEFHMKKDTPTLNRRGFLKAAGAVGIAATAPIFFIKGAYADDKVFRNDPSNLH